MSVQPECPVCRNPMDSDLICCENCNVADVLFRRPFYATDAPPALPEQEEEAPRVYDSGTYGELPAEIRALIVGHEWDNMTRDEQRAWLIGALATSQFALRRALSALPGASPTNDSNQSEHAE